MAKKKTTKVETPVTNVYKKDIVKRPNSEIAKRVIAGEFGKDWKYAVRKMGYNVKAVEVLVYGYLKLGT